MRHRNRSNRLTDWLLVSVAWVVGPPLFVSILPGVSGMELTRASSRKSREETTGWLVWGRILLQDITICHPLKP